MSRTPCSSGSARKGAIVFSKLRSKYRSLPVQAKASFWFLMCAFLQRGISFITTPIFTRILTTAEYGQFSVFNSWMQIITPIVSLNLYSGVYSQGIVKFSDERDQFSSSLQGLSLVLVAAWTAIYLLFSDFFDNLFTLTVAQMLCMFVMIWASGSFSFWSMDQRVDFKYRKLVAVTLLVSAAQPTLSIILILTSEDKVMARILGMTIVQFLFYSWTFVSQMRKGRKFFHKRFWIYALKFNLPLLPHYLSLTLLSSSDRIMISSMVGASEAGIYNLAYSISMVMSMFNTALLQTLEPWIYKKLKAGQGGDLAKVAYPTFVGIAGVNLVLIVLAPEVVGIFAPPQYYEAIWIIPPVALSVYFMYLYTFFATFEFYYEKTGYVAAATVGGAILNVVLNYVCIGMIGYMAAGYTTLVSYMLFAVLHYHFMMKICRESIGGLKPYRTSIIVGISVAALILGFLIQLTYALSVVRYSIVIAVLIAAFVFRDRLRGFANRLIGMRKGAEQ